MWEELGATLGAGLPVSGGFGPTPGAGVETVLGISEGPGFGVIGIVLGAGLGAVT
jgi:hypothetical protein